MDLDFGRLIDLDTEQALIAAVLYDGRLMPYAEHVKPEDFGDRAHQVIWAAILAEYRNGRAPSWSTLRGRLQAEGTLEQVGGKEYLVSLGRNPVGAVDFMVRDFASAIRAKAIRRRYLQIAEEIAVSAADMDRGPEELIARTIAELQRLTADSDDGGLSKRAVAERIVTAISKPLPCYSTGLYRLDDVMGGGLFAGKLYGLAARKKVGKTILAGTISHNLNAREIKHLFIAGEMTPEEIEQRNIARELGLNSIAFLKRDVADLATRTAQYAVRVPDCTVYEAAASATLDDVRRMIGRAIVQHGITGVILDYWQLVEGKGRDETEEFHLRRVAQTLANICHKQGIWAFVTAQINQQGNTRGGEGLRLAADMYLALHREKDSDEAWIEMQETRYTAYRNVGSETEPGLLLNKRGPFFEDAEPGAVEADQLAMEA